MRHPVLIALAGILLMSACTRPDGDAEVQRALQDLDVLESGALSDVMMSVAEPSEAVAYFNKQLSDNPDRIDLQRGLASSLVRAGRTTESISAWKRVIAHGDSNADDRVNLAEAQIRANQWDDAAGTLNEIPPTHETFERYKLEAMVADSNEDWAKADTFYETAAGLTTTPAGVMNNWGFSKLTRGDYAGAERLFTDALRQDGSLFTAKNNLMLARGAQRNYDLPVMPMDQTERARLLYTLALTAIKQSDVTIGKTLLEEAVATHPQYFEEASRALRALEA